MFNTRGYFCTRGYTNIPFIIQWFQNSFMTQVNFTGSSGPLVIIILRFDWHCFVIWRCAQKIACWTKIAQLLLEIICLDTHYLNSRICKIVKIRLHPKTRDLKHSFCIPFKYSWASVWNINEELLSQSTANSAKRHLCLTRRRSACSHVLKLSSFAIRWVHSKK